jgi:hypothetical protein
MSLIAPDILADACSLSLGPMLALVPIGLALWLLGWWSHRFWVVLVATVLAGVYGLSLAPGFTASGLATAVLLALSAGVLALALVRLVAFVAGGLTGLLLVQAAYPSFNQPLVAFVVSGLACLALFRPCMMALTSLAGSLLLVCAALMLGHHYAMLDAPAWCAQSAGLVNGVTAMLALLGLVVQFLLDRYLFRKKTKEKSWLADLLGVRAAPPPSKNASKPLPVKQAA